VVTGDSVGGGVAVAPPLDRGGVQGGAEGVRILSKVVVVVELRSLDLELEPQSCKPRVRTEGRCCRLLRLSDLLSLHRLRLSDLLSLYRLRLSDLLSLYRLRLSDSCLEDLWLSRRSCWSCWS